MDLLTKIRWLYLAALASGVDEESAPGLLDEPKQGLLFGGAK